MSHSKRGGCERGGDSDKRRHHTPVEGAHLRRGEQPSREKLVRRRPRVLLRGLREGDPPAPAQQRGQDEEPRRDGAAVVARPGPGIPESRVRRGLRRHVRERDGEPHLRGDELELEFLAVPLHPVPRVRGEITHDEEGQQGQSLPGGPGWVRGSAQGECPGRSETMQPVRGRGEEENTGAAAARRDRDQPISARASEIDPEDPQPDIGEREADAGGRRRRELDAGQAARAMSRTREHGADVRHDPPRG
ncbi:hypothetical protein F4824DRAFT_94128 [Ustulina deusta]|nr:hypothetical protein F4824DRAFT_94128 [Ustulina deusta]